MLRFPVSTQKQADLNERMRHLQLDEGSIDETYFKSSAGGQSSSKALSGVSLLHRPTGIRVKCQRERSQGINRFLARRLLVEELEARLHGKTRHEVKAEKLREEKDRRRGSRKKHAAETASSGVHETVFDLARAMNAYYLRPLLG